MEWWSRATSETVTNLHADKTALCIEDTKTRSATKTINVDCKRRPHGANTQQKEQNNGLDDPTTKRNHRRETRQLRGKQFNQNHCLLFFAPNPNRLHTLWLAQAFYKT